MEQERCNIPSIKDESTVEAIARAFCGPCKRNKTDTLKTVGYSESYYNGGRSAEIVWGNERVKAAIARIDKETGDKREHDRTVSVELLRQNLVLLSERANGGDIQAIQARTAVIRELNAISNLHSATVFTGDDKPAELSEDQRKAAVAASKAVTGPTLAKETA